MTSTIPFTNHARAFAPDTDAIIDIVREVGDSDEFILKRYVSAFEAALAAHVGVSHAVGLSSGTAALTLLLDALGARRGEGVLVPAWTFAGVATLLLRMGLRPVFVDVEEATGCMDPADLPRRITQDCRQVLAVHTCCSAADMEAIVSVASDNRLLVLEDSAVVTGATVQGRAAGTHGRAGVFSFYPAKPLGGVGDGGMVVTDDDDLAKTVRMLRNHGQDGVTRFLHHMVGYNARMDEIVAAFLQRRLASLDARNERRTALARRYEERLGALEPALALPPAATTGRVFYQYVMRTPERDRLAAFLAEQRIESQPVYPVALPLQPAFRHLGHERGDFPAAERWAGEGLALPLHDALEPADVDTVADAVTAFLEEGGA